MDRLELEGDRDLARQIERPVGLVPRLQLCLDSRPTGHVLRCHENTVATKLVVVNQYCSYVTLGARSASYACTQLLPRVADTSTMTLETALFLASLAAAAYRERAHLEGELGELAERLLELYRPRARA